MWLAQLDSTLDSAYETSLTIDGGTAAGFALFGGVMTLFWLVVAVVMIVAMWKVFVKAGQPGWAAIVPIYNYYILTQIAGRPAWWLLLFFIPFANLIALIVISMDIAKAFGKSEVFGILGLVLFSPIGYLILGFGKDTYKGVATATAASKA